MSVKITYRLTNAGQRASLLAGGDGKNYQTVDVPLDSPEHTLAVELADIDCDGEATISAHNPYRSSGASYEAAISSLDYESIPSTEKLLADEQNRRIAHVEKQGKFERKEAEELEADVQEYLAAGAESMVSEYGTSYREGVKWPMWRVQSDLATEDKRLDEIRANAERIVAERVADVETAVAIKKDEKAVAELAAGKETSDWIEAHGSERLQRCHAEEIECGAAYRDERLAKERPGWEWDSQSPVETDDPRNPNEAAFSMLDEARTIEPDAVLMYGTIDHNADDDEYPSDSPEYDWTGYVAVGRFLGREIHFGRGSSE